MIVVDAGVIACFSIHSEHSALAEAACARDPVWVAPLVWRSEYRNTLLKYMLHSGLSFDLAMLSLRSAEELVAGREYAVDSRKVLELAVKSKCAAYDCEYVALAQDLNVPLVTTDRRLLQAFPRTAVALGKFAKQK